MSLAIFQAELAVDSRCGWPDGKKNPATGAG